MTRLIAAENPDNHDGLVDEPPPCINDVDYVIDTWLERKNYSKYPNAGGYNDQDESLMLDWRTMNLYERRVRSGIFTSVMVDESNVIDLDTLTRD